MEKGEGGTEWGLDLFPNFGSVILPDSYYRSGSIRVKSCQGLLKAELR